jgi:cation diffusion facilitator CzcD-associated flavoprotein CzcO
MHYLSKKIIIPMAAVAVIGAGAYGVTQVSAASGTANPQASLIQKLADTFHVDKSKVQAVFDQNKTDRQAARETTYEAKLSQAVTDGKLKSAQKDPILAEHNRLTAEVKASATGTNADRRAAMTKIRQEATDWAKANNIDAQWLMGLAGPGGRHGGMMGGRMMGQTSDGDTDTAATPSPSSAL